VKGGLTQVLANFGRSKYVKQDTGRIGGAARNEKGSAGRRPRGGTSDSMPPIPTSQSGGWGGSLNCAGSVSNSDSGGRG